jgi:hypothetical protein
VSKEDRLRKYYIEPLSEKLGTPVEVCGVYSRPGATSAALNFAISDGIGMFTDSEGKKASGGLPMNVILALTASELVIFEMKAGMTGKLKLNDPIRRFPRHQLQAEITGQNSMGACLRFTTNEGTFALDANKLPGMDIDWNLALVRALEGPPPSPPPPPSTSTLPPPPPVARTTEVGFPPPPPPPT